MSEDNKPFTGSNYPEFDPKSIVDLDILADQLRATYAHLFTERDKYVAGANKWLEAHPKGVLNDEEEAMLTERIAGILTVSDAYHGKPTSAHTVAKEPFLKGGRVVDAVLNAELKGPLVEVGEKLKKPLKDYKDAKVKRLREEQAAALKRAADEAAREAARASEGQTDMESALAAEQASLDAIAEVENSKTSSISQSRGDLGALSGLRGKWKARVVNESLVPRWGWKLDLEIIEFKMNQSKDKKSGAPTIEIPGVEFYQETSLSVRR